MFIGVHGRIDPEQEGMRDGRPVEQLDGQFEIRAVRVQSHADQPFHPVAAFDFAHPDRLAAVRVFLGNVQSTGMKLEAR
jgi:hypothetical protein